ncbi:hypothetical protein BDZ89DRAFT_1080883 [Hymenopellis radicata]|nr:hypothetical protein BDZ89DRAFT_1080883 [Hymenopellis radicata]
MTDWKGSLNREQKWSHTELSVKNILFKPSDPGCFYVVGWGRAHAITDRAEEAVDGGTLSAIFNRVKKRKVLDQPPAKKPRRS